MKHILLYAYIYIVSSIIIGPFLVFFSAAFVPHESHPSGWDCTDSTWSPTVSIAEREKYYDVIALPMLVGSIIMLILGSIVTIFLIRHAAQTNAWKESIVSLALVGFMMLGYSAIFGLASSPWC